MSIAQQITIDGKGHLLGRLASTVAKQLLNGQKIVVVRCEALNISGEFFRAKRTFYILLRRIDWIGWISSLYKNGRGSMVVNKADKSNKTVKYHAYLRKMTRYNPTRGGKHHHISLATVCVATSI